MIDPFTILSFCNDTITFVKFVVKLINDVKDGHKNHLTATNELESQLKRFLCIFDIVRNLIERIQASAKDNSKALSYLNECICQCDQIMNKLGHSHEKLCDQKNYSRVKLLIKSWMNDKEGKAAVDKLVKEIDVFLHDINTAINCISGQLLLDIHHIVVRKGIAEVTERELDPSSPSTGSTVSWGLSRSSTVSSATLVDRSEFKLEGQNSPGLAHDLILAIQEKDQSKVQALLKCGVDLLEQDADGRCGLHYAVKTNSKRVMRELLESDNLKKNPKGINSEDRNGATPLHFAASIGEEAMAEELLKNKADNDAVDKYGRSPLLMAIKGNHEKVVELLLDSKAKIPNPPPKRLKGMQTAISYRKRMEAKKKISA
ncbi:Ankyrin repeat-containing domain protein [Elaphomyces granulatus]